MHNPHQLAQDQEHRRGYDMAWIKAKQQDQRVNISKMNTMKSNDIGNIFLTHYEPIFNNKIAPSNWNALER